MAGTISPKPSFHLCPDFSIAPPPNGHLQLGSILQDLAVDSVLTPLDIGNTVPVSELQLWPQNKAMEKLGFSRSLKELRSLEGSIWAKIFGWDGLGALFYFLRKREDDETLTVEKLLVRYFIPTSAYIKQALEIDGVRFYIKHNKFKKPIYIVTGLMWTEGAKLSKLHSKNIKVSSQAAARNPNSGTSGGGSGGFESAESLSSSFDGSTPFVLGIRVRKIWWDKEGTRHDAHDTIGATLGAAKVEMMNVLDGLRFVDDEVVSAAGQGIVDETQVGSEDPVIWILP